MKVNYETHACLSIELDNDVVVCDPWILQQPVYNYSTWKFPDIKKSPREIASSATRLFITHTHEDHFHIPSLDLFNREIPIYISKFERHKSPRSKTLFKTLVAIGFTNIRQLGDWETVEIVPGGYLTLVPFAKTRSHDWENAGFVIEHGGSVLLNMNDNVSDEELCQQIRSRFPAIDIAFIQSMGVTMWPGRYRMSLKEMRHERLLKAVDSSEQKRMVDIVRPNAVVPFAGDFCWLADRYQHQNWSNRGIPELFTKFVIEEAENKSIDVFLMEPGDYWTKKNGWIKVHPRVDWDKYLNLIELLAIKKAKHLASIDAHIDSFSDVDVRNVLLYRLNYTKQNITSPDQDFNIAIKYVVESRQNDLNVEFYIWINQGVFGYSTESAPCQVVQTWYVSERIMQAILGGGLSWTIIQWVVDMQQHSKPKELGSFLYWLEYNMDLHSPSSPEFFIDTKLISPEYSNPAKPFLVFDDFDADQ